MQITANVQGRHAIAIFVLASATLSYQILITRFFSVMLYYHFAFAAISDRMASCLTGSNSTYANRRLILASKGALCSDKVSA